MFNEELVENEIKEKIDKINDEMKKAIEDITHSYSTDLEQLDGRSLVILETIFGDIANELRQEMQVEIENLTEKYEELKSQEVEKIKSRYEKLAEKSVNF